MEYETENKPKKGKSADMDDMDDLDKQLDTVIENYEEWEEQTRDSRAMSERSRDYFDGKQWTDKELGVLEARNQPATVDNKLKDKLEYIVGMEAASRTDPKAYPRTPNDEDDSEAATDALRFVAENNDLDTIVSDIAENMIIEGYGGCEVEVEKRGKKVQVTITQSPWDRMYYQPHSRRKDFGDARYRGIFVWMDEDQARDENPDVDWDSVIPSMQESASPYGESSEDKPSITWYDRGKKRLRVMQQYYYWKGKIYHCKFVKGAWIEKPSESKYKDEDGLPEMPYAWMSAYVDRENNRYGVSRRYEDLQDSINHRKSKASHLMNSNQITAEEGAVQNKQEARKQANLADGYIEINPNFTFQIDKNMDLSMGQAQLLQQDLEAMRTTGPKAIGGASSASGRSKQLDNQTDVIELGRLFDQLRMLKREIYRMMWNRIKQFWTDERWVRITDDEGAPKFVQLNKPVSNLEQAELLGQKMQNGEIPPEEFQQALMMAQSNPDGVARKQNNVGELDVDIIIDEAPDMVNLQSEQFQGLVTLAQAGVIFPPELYVEASALRNKDRLLEKLTGGDDPAMQEAAKADQQLSQAERQTALKELAASASEKEARARKTTAEAEYQELETAIAKGAVKEATDEMKKGNPNQTGFPQ
jgi:hypothetical protein